MGKQTVVIDIPDGWVYADYRKPCLGEALVEDGVVVRAQSTYLHSQIIVTQAKVLLRRVFDLTSETKNVAHEGDYFSMFLTTAGIGRWSLATPSTGYFYIWREITEATGVTF